MSLFLVPSCDWRRSRVREFVTDRFADARAAARDDCNLSVQFAGHRELLQDLSWTKRLYRPEVHVAPRLKHADTAKSCFDTKACSRHISMTTLPICCFSAVRA